MIVSPHSSHNLFFSFWLRLDLYALSVSPSIAHLLSHQHFCHPCGRSAFFTHSPTPKPITFSPLPLQDRLDHLTTHVMDVTLRTHDRTHFDVFFFCFLRLSSTVTSPRRRLSQLSFDTTRISPIFARACAFMTRNAFGVEGSASTKLSTTHTHTHPPIKRPQNVLQCAGILDSNRQKMRTVLLCDVLGLRLTRVTLIGSTLPSPPIIQKNWPSTVPFVHLTPGFR